MITYKIGLNGNIDDSKEYTDEYEAIIAARILIKESTCTYDIAWVYGFDDNPNALTKFWRHWGIDDMGRISIHGANIFVRYSI